MSDRDYLTYSSSLSLCRRSRLFKDERFTFVKGRAEQKMSVSLRVCVGHHVKQALRRACILVIVFALWQLPMSALCNAEEGALSEEQYRAPDKHFVERDKGVWFGLYTSYWLTEKWGYYGEYHVRRADLLDRMSKLYIRVGANYKVDDGLKLTFGVVNRYTWSDFPDSPAEEKYVPEFRFWEQLLFKNYYFGMRFYHQIRIEQRWKRSTKIIDPTYYYYNRFRYTLETYT